MIEQNRSRLVKFIIILISINLVLFFAWLFIQQRNDNQKLLKEMAQIRDEVSMLQDDMKSLGPNTKEEIQQTVAAAKDEMLVTETEAALVKNYRNSITAISSIKLVLSESFVNEGKFPAQIPAHLIGDIHQYETGVIDAIEIALGDVPRISVALKNFEAEKVGGYYLDGHRTEIGSVHWDCKTFGDLLLKRALPECDYIAE